MLAYSIKVSPGASNQADAVALLYELNWCDKNGFHMVWGETDSMLIVKSVQEEWRTPWRISHQVKEIQRQVQ